MARSLAAIGKNGRSEDRAVRRSQDGATLPATDTMRQLGQFVRNKG
jgi:hypothetical protein